MSEYAAHSPSNSDMHFCALHPERDTELRCNRCERYMCVECAQRTPVGYTCRQCLRSHEDKFFTGGALDYVIVAALGAAGGAAMALLMTLIGGFLLLGVVIAPALGGAIAQLALGATGRRRGRHSGLVCAASVLLGGLALGLFISGMGLFSLIYLGLAASAAFARFKLSI